jgi:hypothetical protein
VPDVPAPVPAGEQHQPAGRERRRRIGRRPLAALSAAGVAAAVILTGAASSVPAASAATAAGRPVPAAAPGPGVTENVVLPSGTMTIRVRYVRGSSGRLAAVRYAGHARTGVRHAVLIFSVSSDLPGRQVKPGAVVRVKPTPATGIIWILKLKPSVVRRFSGSVPARVLASVNKYVRTRPGSTLTLVLGQAVTGKPGGKPPIAVRVVLPGGVVLFP